MKRIHDSLHRVLQRQRLVFWYDTTGEWAETFLCSANRWTAEVDALFGVLPSYTQLGMAALLPGKHFE